MKRKALSEENKGSLLALLAEEYSEHQVVAILKISKTAVQVRLRTRSSSRHWGQQSYRPAEVENDFLLTVMTVNSFECHSATVG